MFKKLILSIFTLGIYPIVSKGRNGRLEKKTKKYRSDGTLKKDVSLLIDFDDEQSPTPPNIE